jgi:hypothetical protein
VVAIGCALGEDSVTEILLLIVVRDPIYFPPSSAFGTFKVKTVGSGGFLESASSDTTASAREIARKYTCNRALSIVRTWFSADGYESDPANENPRRSSQEATD